MHKSWKRRVEQMEPRVVRRLVADVLGDLISASEPQDVDSARKLLEQVGSGLERMLPLLKGLNCVIPANEGSGTKSISKSAEAIIEDLYRSGDIVVLDDQPAIRAAACTPDEFVKELLDLASHARVLNDLQAAKKALRDVYSGLRALADEVGSINDKSVEPDYLLPYKVSQNAADIVADLILSGELEIY